MRVGTGQWLWAFLTLLTPPTVSAQTIATEPASRLDPALPHVEVFLNSYAPRIRFFAGGVPVVEVNATGLFSDGRLVCSWPGGTFDSTRAEEMVLGYRDAAATVFTGCPAHTPIRSFWYYEYGRWAKLLIEDPIYHPQAGMETCNLTPAQFVRSCGTRRIRGERASGRIWSRVSCGQRATPPVSNRITGRRVR